MKTGEPDEPTREHDEQREEEGEDLPDDQAQGAQEGDEAQFPGEAECPPRAPQETESKIPPLTTFASPLTPLSSL